jgi:alkyl hydroperoxide reductase subunit D
MTQAIDALRDTLPDAARDLKINLGTVLALETLTPAQRWGSALACAIAAGHTGLRHAVAADARAAGVSEEVLDDARAAAALMAMNNVIYRSRHMLGGTYEARPVRLRMQRIGAVKSNKIDFELMCLAASAVGGCEVCLQAHEKVVREGGISEDAVFDAVRIAAVVKGVAVGLALGA